MIDFDEAVNRVVPLPDWCPLRQAVRWIAEKKRPVPDRREQNLGISASPPDTPEYKKAESLLLLAAIEGKIKIVGHKVTSKLCIDDKDTISWRDGYEEKSSAIIPVEAFDRGQYSDTNEARTSFNYESNWVQTLYGPNTNGLLEQLVNGDFTLENRDGKYFGPGFEAVEDGEPTPIWGALWTDARIATAELLAVFPPSGSTTVSQHAGPQTAPSADGQTQYLCPSNPPSGEELRAIICKCFPDGKMLGISKAEPIIRKAIKESGFKPVKDLRAILDHSEYAGMRKSPGRPQKT